MTDRPRRTGTSKGFLGTVVMAGFIIGVLAYLDIGARRDGQAGSVVLFYFESVFSLLPVAAGLVAAQTRRISVRALLSVVVVTTGLMVAQDFLPASELTLEKRAVAYVPLTQRWEVAREYPARWQEGGTLPIVVDYALGRFDRIDVPPPWDEGEQRVHASYGVMKLAYLLLPFITVGFVVGVRRWVAHNVMFRTRSGERLFLFLVAWVVGPAVPLIIFTIGEMTRGSLVMASSSLWAIATPHFVFALLAALAWKGVVQAGTTGFDIDEA